MGQICSVKEPGSRYAGGNHTVEAHYQILCSAPKGRKDKKPKPVREDSFSPRLFFEHNELGYVDTIVDLDRETKSGPKGYLPSAIFAAMLPMYLQSMGSILDLIRFLKTDLEWLVLFNLRKRIDGVMTCRVRDRTTFYKFAKRLGPDRIIEIFAVMVVRLMQAGIITGEKVSLDSSTICAWFKDCKYANKPNHDNRRCRHHRARDRDASWSWDRHREMFVFGFKVHIAIDSLSGLPMMLTVTRAGYGDSRAVPWFVRTITKRLCLLVKKFMADAGYDGYRARLVIIRKLKAVLFITLNPRNCKGNTKEENRQRCKKLRYRWYAKNFPKKFWVDPDSEEFDKEFDSRTFSEQGFYVGKGSLNLDALKGKGKARATLHATLICMVMLGVAKTATEIGRPDLTRPVKCFQGR
jgi:transposase